MKLKKEYITIDPKKFGHEEAVTSGPIFNVYKETVEKGEELVAVLQGKGGIALLKRKR
jgi:hypothetical protein